MSRLRAVSCAVSYLGVILAVAALGCGGGPGAPEGEAGAAAAAAVSAACAALLPSFGAPVDLRFDTGTHNSCWAATTSSTGEVALGTTNGLVTADFDLFTPAGAPAEDPASFGPSGISIPYSPTSLDLDPVLHASGNGWQGIVHPFSEPAAALITWTAGGTIVSTVPLITARVSAPDGHGGSVVAGTAGSLLTDPPHLLWVNAAGTVTRDVHIDRVPALLLVEWGSGHVLVVASAGPPISPTTSNARWFDGSGHPLTPWFSTHTVLTGVTMLHLLRDGRIALSANGAWTVAIHDGTTAVDHAPSWLASRPGTRLATIPGGYAVLTDGPSAFGAGPTAQLEVLTATGASCGVVHPPPGSAPAGVTRTTSSFFVGQDGTLIESSMLESPTDVLGSGIHCAFRWWPRLWVSH